MKTGMLLTPVSLVFLILTHSTSVFAQPSSPCPTPTPIVSDIPGTIQFMGVKLGVTKPIQGFSYWLDVILRIIIPFAPQNPEEPYPCPTPIAYSTPSVLPPATPTSGPTTPFPTAPPGVGAANLPVYPPVSSASCTITYTGPIDGKTKPIPPGSIICVPAKTYSVMRINNITGSADKPIGIINQGGQVIISGGGGFGIDMNNNKYFHLTGTGDPAVKYGFKVQGGFSQGARIDDGSRDFALDHIEITGVGIGLGTKTKAEAGGGCTGFTQNNFTQTNTVIHDLYVHNVNSEAMYVGANFTSNSSSGQGSATGCGYHPVLKGLWIYDNIVDSFGKDGINAKGTPENCNIYNNTVKNGSTNRDPSQNGGIAATSNTSCDIYNNTITSQWGPGIQDNGNGGNRISNNSLSNIDGIGIQLQCSMPGGGTTIISGNTITNATGGNYKDCGRGNILP